MNKVIGTLIGVSIGMAFRGILFASAVYLSVEALNYIGVWS